MCYNILLKERKGILRCIVLIQKVVSIHSQLSKHHRTPLSFIAGNPPLLM